MQQIEEDIYIEQEKFHMPNIRPSTSKNKPSLSNILNTQKKAIPVFDEQNDRKEIILERTESIHAKKPKLSYYIQRKGSLTASSK